jgi:nickel-dependent lactate racemase
LIDILRTQKPPTAPDTSAETKRLIESNERLQKMTREAKGICIALGPCGNIQLAGDLIKALHQSLAKNPQVPITILCSPGAVELDPNSLPETKIVRHHPEASPTLPIDSFKGGFSPQLNSQFMSADLKIIVGELKPHPFLNYSGLCDIVFPGTASEISVQNHLSNRTGYSALDLRKERFEITNLVGDVFALGVILDSDKTPVQVALGSITDSLSTLQDASQNLFPRNVTKPADIVVMSAGGTPQDESLLQAVETFPAGLAVLKRNGALIVAAECGKGHGDTEFYEWCAERKEPRHLETRLRHRFNYNGFKAAFLKRTLETHRIYLVSTIPDHYVENIFGMKTARTANAALQTAQRALGSDSTISVIPDASRVIPRLQALAQ